MIASALVATAAAGVRPRDRDAALLGTSCARRMAHIALYEAALDRGDVAEAGVHVDALLRLCADAADPIAYNEAAYYVARHRGDARRARSRRGAGAARRGARDEIEDLVTPATRLSGQAKASW